MSSWQQKRKRKAHLDALAAKTLELAKVIDGKLILARSSSSSDEDPEIFKIKMQRTAALALVGECVYRNCIGDDLQPMDRPSSEPGFDGDRSSPDRPGAA